MNKILKIFIILLIIFLLLYIMFIVYQKKIKSENYSLYKNGNNFLANYVVNNNFKKYGKCFIGGCVYNCGKYLENVINKIHQIGNIFDEYIIIIAYDHSNDNSLEILKKAQSSFKNFFILINQEKNLK
jgi:hypothetical protein